jgi:hypothetical protein
MRTQYYFRQSERGLCAWRIERLIELSHGLPRERVPLSAIREVDEPFWCGAEGQKLTCRQVVDHARLMRECELSYPIMLSSDGRVMDGMHRVCRALLEGFSEIEAVRFIEDPEPDYVGVDPDELPYPNQ